MSLRGVLTLFVWPIIMLGQIYGDWLSERWNQDGR